MIRPHGDNHIIRMVPEPKLTSGGLHIPDQARDRAANQTRMADVISSGPGRYAERVYQHAAGVYHRGTERFVPNSVKPGDRVLVLAKAGDHYDPRWDHSIPRRNPELKMDELDGEEGDYRWVRDDEILGVVEP